MKLLGTTLIIKKVMKMIYIRVSKKKLSNELLYVQLIIKKTKRIAHNLLISLVLSLICNYLKHEGLKNKSKAWHATMILPAVWDLA